MNKDTTRTHSLRASHGQAPAKPDPAYSEACNLATALFEKHYARQWPKEKASVTFRRWFDEQRASHGQAPAGATMGDKLRDMIEGMSVSVDVSTDDATAGHRYFGTVTEVMECQGDKYGVTLLVQDAEPNFKAQADSVQEDAARYQWLFGARTEAQAASVSETVFKPLPQDEVLSHLQGFYMSKTDVDALVDAARRQGGAG